MPRTVDQFFQDVRTTYYSRFDGYLITPTIGRQFYRRHTQTEMECCVLGAAYWQHIPDTHRFDVFNSKSTSYMSRAYIEIYPWMGEVVHACPEEWGINLKEPTVWHVIQMLWDGYLFEKDVHKRDWNLALDRLEEIIEGLFADAV